MSRIDVQVVEIPPSRVVSAYAYGEEPEMKSHDKLCAFLDRAGWDAKETERHRFFGFNNPDPAPGSPQYGYEHIVTVADSFVLPEGLPEGIELKSVPGGRYASLRVTGVPNPSKWGDLVRWINGSPYQYDATRQWLEEVAPEALTRFLTKGSDPETWQFNLMSPVVQAAHKVK